MKTIRVIVSGTTYYDSLDPLCTGVPEEIGLLPYDKRAKRVRCGRGVRVDYGELPEPLVLDLIDHLDTAVYLRLHGTDPDDYASKAAGRAIRKDVERISAALRDA